MLYHSGLEHESNSTSPNGSQKSYHTSSLLASGTNEHDVLAAQSVRTPMWLMESAPRGSQARPCRSAWQGSLSSLGGACSWRGSLGKGRCPGIQAKTPRPRTQSTAEAWSSCLFLMQRLHRHHRRCHLGLRSSKLVFIHDGCSRVRGEHGVIVRIDFVHGHYEGGRHPEEQSTPQAHAEP